MREITQFGNSLGGRMIARLGSIHRRNGRRLRSKTRNSETSSDSPVRSSIVVKFNKSREYIRLIVSFLPRNQVTDPPRTSYSFFQRWLHSPVDCSAGNRRVPSKS